ncbi:Uncharacterised protein [Burkholderia pseudomallei]|nr:Uncharacterised protein [Burkholderia pseudomallei]CAJ7901544.1 Uncharacterised protein [Burkholderia pseudomallei]CAK0430057.1 Uncharacterised protein [Burkholderia pseudomallei]CAK0451872.1 Uncharacterised protein [Burkholderia pseudomallei]CAK0453310.1 Uncharacterised protein [Burkholderia pseudomallei]
MALLTPTIYGRNPYFAALLLFRVESTDARGVLKISAFASVLPLIAKTFKPRRCAARTYL